MQLLGEERRAAKIGDTLAAARGAGPLALCLGDEEKSALPSLLGKPPSQALMKCVRIAYTLRSVSVFQLGLVSTVGALRGLPA